MKRIFCYFLDHSVQQYEITFQPKDIRACLMNGMAQLIIGCLCVIFGIVQICITCYYGEEAVPIWCGFWVSGLVSINRFIVFFFFTLTNHKDTKEHLCAHDQTAYVTY